jgi:hypothetical protein
MSKTRKISGYSKWDTPHKKEDWNERKERPDAGMILKKRRKSV